MNRQDDTGAIGDGRKFKHVNQLGRGELQQEIVDAVTCQTVAIA